MLKAFEHSNIVTKKTAGMFFFYLQVDKEKKKNEIKKYS